MIISIVGKHSKTLLDDFDAAGVKYERRPPQAGVIMNSGEMVRLAQFSLPIAAGVITAWIKCAPTRKVTITTKDGTVFQAEGRSVAEVEHLLTIARSAIIVDMKNSDSKAADDIGTGN